jgi:AcrR family transcriptional regulator
MGNATKTKKIQRRAPVQARALDTVELIFEATARILAKTGRDGVNTNRIAETAGISVGTLYGYFPNKQTILLAMAHRELDRLRDAVEAALTRPEPGGDPVRIAVRVLIREYGAGGNVRRILMETLFAHGGSTDMARPVSEIAEIIRSHAGGLIPGGAAPSQIGLYVLTRAVDGVIRTATYDQVTFLNSPEFETELLRLVYGYLSATTALDRAPKQSPEKNVRPRTRNV